MNGTTPVLQSGENKQGHKSFAVTYSAGDTSQNKHKDSFLCTDLLSTEKHVSSTYNTCIFEFRDSNIRDVLNHIQKEEQQHGEQIYNYMAQNAMYN
jgi:spore coat protein CotF